MTFLLPFAWKGAMKRKQERIMGSDGELNVLKEKVLSEFLSVVSYPINSNLINVECSRDKSSYFERLSFTPKKASKRSWWCFSNHHHQVLSQFSQ